jgi:hypothetical protein
MVQLEANGLVGIYDLVKDEEAMMANSYLGQIAEVIGSAQPIAQNARGLGASKELQEAKAGEATAKDPTLQKSVDKHIAGDESAYRQAVQDGLLALGPVLHKIVDQDDALREAFGAEALHALDNPDDWVTEDALLVACQLVFQGMQRMGRVAVDKYGQKPPSEEGDDGGGFQPYKRESGDPDIDVGYNKV